MWFSLVRTSRSYVLSDETSVDDLTE